MSTATTDGIAPVPAPWTLKGTIYAFMIYISGKDAANLSSENSFLYSPLESDSSFANNEPVGGLGMVQVIRYSESPVGPYDELVMVPGNFKDPPEAESNKSGTSIRKNLMVTRAYVSQEKTCWNGRMNWNIPKHLARFDFKELPHGAISISIFPFETDTSGTKSKPSRTPFFSAVYKNIPYVPSFPATTNLSKLVGLDLSLVQPPLPEEKGAKGELPGTQQWCKVLPLEWSSRTSVGWWDLKSKEGTETQPLLDRTDGERSTDRENWWPGSRRWRIGMKMEDATIVFPEAEKWTSPNASSAS